MNRKRLIANPLAQSCAALLIAGSVAFSASSVWAATQAGEEIRNLATVTYEDAAGNVFSAQSNEAIVIVAQVYSATLGVDVDVNAAAGTTVYLPYILSNTGNGTDVFDLTAIDGITGGADINASNITIFHDVNGNGEPDPGPGEPAITSISIDDGDSADLVVAVQIPPTATPGQTVGITLTAQAQEGSGAAVVGSVTDLSPGTGPTGFGGRDGLDDTNESLITVTNDAVIDINKQITSVDTVNNRITYTLTVRNNGGQAANDVVIFDGLPENTTFFSTGGTGLIAPTDTLSDEAVLSETILGIDLNADGDSTDVDEAGLGLDLNSNGVSTDTAVDGIFAIDAELPAGNTVTVTLTVEYDPALFNGNDDIFNQAFASGDTNNDGVADILVSSNRPSFTVDADYGVTITDTGINGAPGVNDGGDDDNAINQDQLVDEAAVGGFAVFSAIITNTGNSNDSFNLSISPTGNNFPPLTTFTFFDETGLVPLVDSGTIAPGDSKTIIIRANLLDTATGAPPAPATEYQATVVAVSANDPAVTPASDTVDVSLETIVVAEVDLHNSPNGLIGTDEDALSGVPYTAITSFAGQPGTTVNIPLYIDNESEASDSYVLDAGSSLVAGSLGALPAGWSVQFFIGDGAGNPTGSAVSTTTTIPAGDVDFEVIAVVSIPADSTQAVNDFVFDNDGDGTPDTLDGDALNAGDGDGDYPIFFQIISLNTGASDTKLDSIDVNDSRALSLIPPSSQNIDPGSSVTYTHTLTNNGNVTESVELTASNSQTGWATTLSIDTNGDGNPDTLISALDDTLTLPTDSLTITVQQNNGVDIVVTVTDTDSDGIAELELLPGYSIPLTAVVFAPANAPINQTDLLTISADNSDAAGPSVQVIDQTTVVNGQVVITKTVAVNTDCDGTEDDIAFLETQTDTVEPGQCAIWRVVAENTGAVDALNVIITDSVTDFSDYEPGTLRYCLGDSCDINDIASSVNDAANGDNGTVTGSTITFYIGDGINPTAGEGGLLISGQKATVQFAVRVQ